MVIECNGISIINQSGNDESRNETRSRIAAMDIVTIGCVYIGNVSGCTVDRVRKTQTRRPCIFPPRCFVKIKMSLTVCPRAVNGPWPKNLVKPSNFRKLSRLVAGPGGGARGKIEKFVHKSRDVVAFC